ncbi:Tyrosine-protein kinase YwqD [anaerobic digester metagenome]
MSFRLFGGKTDHGVQNIKTERQHILGKKTPFSIVEELKTLRTNIQFSTTSEGCKVIGVTSSDAGEGKSITALNLAITFAETQSRVLLIDCDLRKPKVSRLLKVKAVPGLSNVLVNMNSVQEAIQTVQLETTSIDVLLSGDIPPNPSELLGSRKMKELIESLSNRYDYILVDTPPVGVVTDAVIVSSLFTGMIFVIRASRTQQDAVHSALSQLKFAGANVLGFVLNGVNAKGNRRYSSYRSYKEAAAR